jgi:hypothetical protein
MPTEYTHRVALVIDEGAAYAAARVAMSQITGEPADADADWRPATDGTADAVTGEWVVTHRVCNTLARASTVAALPTLEAQLGGSWHVLEQDRDTTPEHPRTFGEALAEAGVWLLERDEDPETGAPASAWRRVER